jgi:hypothetical protein
MGYFVRPSPGRKAAALLTGVGIGAALMYVLDPDRGKRRRALVRDKAVSLANQTGRIVAKKSRDLTNRAKGMAAGMRSAAGAPAERRDARGPGNGRERSASVERPASGGGERPTERPGGL